MITLREAARPSLRLFSSADDESLAIRHGFDLAFLLARAGRNGRHSDRSTSPLEVEESDGRRLKLFVKVQRGLLRMPRMKDMLRGAVFQSMPEREWNGLLALEHIGLRAAEPLCVIREGLIRADAAIVTRAVPPGDSLQDLLLLGRWNRLEPGARMGCLDEIRNVVARIHDAGLRWRSMLTRHLFPEQMPDGDWRIWLIDCEGVQPRCSSDDIVRDMRRLISSLRSDGADCWMYATFEKLATSLATSAARFSRSRGGIGRRFGKQRVEPSVGQHLTNS